MLGSEPTRAGGLLLDRREMRAVARRALDEVGHENIAPETVAGDLSLAGQQLVEIARAVAVGCRVLVLDEPTSSLTQKDVGKLFALVRRLQARGGGGHLHLSRARRSAGALRPAHRPARRRERRRRHAGGRAGGAHRLADGGPRHGRPLPAHPAHSRRGRAGNQRPRRVRRDAAPRHALPAPGRDRGHRGARRRGPHGTAPHDLRVKSRLRGHGAAEVERGPDDPRAMLAGRHGHGQRGPPARGPWRSRCPSRTT